MTTQEKLYGLLRYFADVSTRHGDLMMLDANDIEEVKKKLEFSDNYEIGFFLQGLEERGLVKTRIAGGYDVLGASVTMEGYLRLDEQN